MGHRALSSTTFRPHQNQRPYTVSIPQGPRDSTLKASIPHHSCEERVPYLLRNTGAEPAVFPQLPAIICDAQLRVNLAVMGSDMGGRHPAECYNMRVIQDIYSFEVTRTLTANSGFRQTSGQPWYRVGRYDEVTLIT